MAKDITEDFQIDLSATESINSSSTAGLLYDVMFDGKGFFDATASDNPYRRQTAAYKKDQQDNSTEPGEQSFTGWWLRSQSSFHYGAGIQFYEPSQDPNLRYRFDTSEGVEVFNPGQLTLLPQADVVYDSGAPKDFNIQGKAVLRNIPNQVLVHTDGDVYRVDGSGTVVHFIDSADTIFSICDDGKYAYYITNTASKGTLWRKPLTGVAGTTTDEVQLYSHPTSTPSNTILEYVKDRLVVASGNLLYEVAVSSGSSSATPNDFYTQSNTDFVFTSITESQSDIYVAGYQGVRSVIYRVYFYDVSGTGLPEPTTALVVAELPRGEIVHSIKHYLGYMVIGTNFGVRIAAVNDDGSLTYGPLLFRTSQPVYQITASDRFVYVTDTVNGKTGLVKIDLGTQFEQLQFPYANDMQADEENACVGVAFVGSTERIAFCSDTYLYIESATELVSEGWLRTGKIRFATTEDKYFKYIKPTADYTGGTITLETPQSQISTTSPTVNNQDFKINESAPAESKQFVFRLKRDDDDSTLGPTLYNYQVKGLPSVRRQRLIQFNLHCYDSEEDRHGNRTGYDGSAFTRILDFENLESTSDIVFVEDLRTGESFNAMIEEVLFTSVTPANRRFSGFGGVLTVTVRKI